MRTLDQITLKPNDRDAIGEVAAILRQRFPISQLVLFGSKARGDDRLDSDIDLLVLTGRPVTPSEKDAITDALFDTQIRRQVVLTPLVVPQAEWDGPLWQVLPIHHYIEREGVVL